LDVQNQRESLQKELELIEATTTEEERAEAVRKASLSTTAAIIEARDEEIKRLKELKIEKESERDALQEEKDKQVIILENFQKVQERIDAEITENFQGELDKRLGAFEDFVSKVR
jgi:hypothetical protein